MPRSLGGEPRARLAALGQGGAHERLRAIAEADSTAPTSTDAAPLWAFVAISLPEGGVLDLETRGLSAQQIVAVAEALLSALG